VGTASITKHTVCRKMKALKLNTVSIFAQTTKELTDFLEKLLLYVIFYLSLQRF
jgi:hypothetical protein